MREREYQRLERDLARGGVEHSAAEAHGLLCGFLVSMRPSRENWLAEIRPAGFADEDRDLQACGERLSGLYDATAEALAAADLSFEPLLPQDDALADRAEALRGWCRGFLDGLGLSGGAPEAAFSAEAREALQDLSAIGRLDADAVAEDETEDQALTDLVEFLKVAVLLIREDLRRRAHEH